MYYSISQIQELQVCEEGKEEGFEEEGQGQGILAGQSLLCMPSFIISSLSYLLLSFAQSHQVLKVSSDALARAKSHWSPAFVCTYLFNLLKYLLL